MWSIIVVANQRRGLMSPPVPGLAQVVELVVGAGGEGTTQRGVTFDEPGDEGGFR